MPDLEAREQLENDLERVLIRAFASARKVLEDALYKEGMTTADLGNIPADILREIQRDLERTISPILHDGYIRAAQNFSEQLNYHIDPDELNIRADEWVNRYVPLLVGGLLSNRLRRLSRIAQQEAQALSKRDLSKILLLIFALGATAIIARTEITNAISAGEMTIEERLKQAGAIVDPLWFTQNDEKVCPICEPRHGKKKGNGWHTDPPAHPRCRCYKGYRIELNGRVTVIFDDEAIARQLRR